MSRRLKSYLDDDCLKAKKVWREFEREQNKYFKSPQSFKDKIWNEYICSKGFVSQKFSNSEKARTVKLLTQSKGYSPQVLIKITGTDQNFNQLKSHVKYISRDGLLDVFVSDTLTGDDEISLKNIDEIAETFRDGAYDILSKREQEKQKLKPKNEVLHMVFSMKGENNIPGQDIKSAAIKTIKEKFSNHHFIIAIHNDTDNPHCHLDLKLVDKTGKESILWGKHLEKLMDEHNITNGDYARFAVTAQEPVVKKIYDKKTKQWYEKTVYKNIWDCSVEGKREILLESLSESEKKKTKFKVLVGGSIPVIVSDFKERAVSSQKQNKSGVSITTQQKTQIKPVFTIQSGKETTIKKQDFER